MAGKFQVMDKDRAEPFNPDPGFEERMKKALEEFKFAPPKPPEGRFSPKCCPHCWMHEPIGFGL